jgi:hypothetical protein
MKRLPILFFAALCAVACEEPGAQKPTGKPYVIKGEGIAAIPAGSKTLRAAVEGYGTVAETTVENGGFELSLPATLPDEALSSVATDPRTKGVTVSDAAARFAFLNLEFDGSFVSISLDNSHLSVGETANDDDEGDGDEVVPVAFTSRKALFIYADRPVTLSGEARWEQVAGGKLPIGGDEAAHSVQHTTTWVEITLAEGWNRVCSEESVVLGSERYEVKSIVSHKNLDDCRWNLLTPAPAPTPDPDPTPAPDPTGK